MHKKILIFSILILFLFVGPKKVFAVENPLAVANNIYGIHILDENDLQDAANLVNSNGGDWGYVTLVIRNNERDTKRWQNVFDQMRRLHLIPIIRIATKQSDGGWEKPNFDEINGWIGFLNSLNWVVKNRYIVIGNEPNHSKEWGGQVNPIEYADYLYTFSQKLKSSSGDFFVIPAGFDASAPNSKDTFSEDLFLRQMIEYKPDIFNYVDGWASHSYPNPNFSGSKNTEGRGSVRTYKWELKFLDSLGIKKQLPIFITETGWAHDKGDNINGFKDTSIISDKFKAALEIAWKDERIVAITPFILNYQSEPFDIFSWKKNDGTFYEIYQEVQKLPKISGKPTQIAAVDVISLIFPPLIPSDGYLSGIVLIENTGQQIWKGTEKIYTENRGHEVTLEPITHRADIEPEDRTFAIVKVKLGKN